MKNIKLLRETETVPTIIDDLVREIETQEEEKKKAESELEDANLIIEELKEEISDLQEQLKAKYMHTDEVTTSSRNDGNTVLPAVFIQWIDVSVQLPPIPKDVPDYAKKVKVIGCWDKQWAKFDYVQRIVRGKVIDRFEWNGRINTFPITHWMIPVCP